MDRVARAAAVALILLAAAPAPAAEAPGREPSPPRASGKGKGSPPPERGKGGEGERRLEEVRITGTAESPDVLFFLPRARFRLLPPRPERDWKERLLADSPELEKAPR
jgi:hypothetical protein